MRQQEEQPKTLSASLLQFSLLWWVARPHSHRRVKGSPAHAEGVEHRRSPRSLGRNKARPAGGGWDPSGGWATGSRACGPQPE